MPNYSAPRMCSEGSSDCSWTRIYISGGSRSLEGGRRDFPLLPCSPAHLNDLVSGRLFTEPGCTELGS